MKRITLSMLALLSLLLVPSSLRAQSPSPYPEYPDLKVVDGNVLNHTAGYSVLIPPTYKVDTVFITRLHAMPAALGHGWGFIDSARVNTRITIGYGGSEIDEAAWRKHADESVSIPRTAGQKILQQSVEWRSDTASFTVVSYDPRYNRYEKKRCIGTKVGRNSPARVCVTVLSPDQSVGDDVLASLHFISQR